MKSERPPTSRRNFLKSTAAAATGLTLAGRAPVIQARGANERIRLGFIGVGNRGTQLLHGFMANQDVEIAAICDVYQPFLERDNSKIEKHLVKALGGFLRDMDENLGSEVARYQDYRKVLEHKDIDAVVISTPDHWHAIQTIEACQAGKDVYVEKPLSATIVEGRRMVDVAKSTNRVVQVGLHRRSSDAYQKVASAIQSGEIGKVTSVRAYRISNMMPHGIGRYPKTSPPASLDWDLWLGPRAYQSYQDNIAPYKFRWWQSYSSQVGNWGVHQFDAVRWALQEEAPVSISAHGGRYAVDDDRTIPDTMEVIFELPSGCLFSWSQYEASGGEALKAGEIEFRGTKGNLYSSGGGYQVEPSMPGQFQNWEPSISQGTYKAEGGNLNITGHHIRNFLDSVKSRQRTNCDMEAGHRSTTFALLANIALATRSRLEWDTKKEKVVNNPEANQLLHYEYRKPWRLT